MGERQACPERSRRGGGDRAKIEFLTPLRLKVRNRYTDSPTFTDLLEHLVARVEALARYHGPATNGLDGAEALAAARQVRVAASDLKWHDWERYSARQETRMKLGGVVGRMEVEGVPDSLWPWLRLGEMIHVGKGTSFGLGRYRVRISKPAQPAQEHR
jgi:CRISPR/Cas system endoribonuclease Cas6 (RAMP superfamily)